jgi:hypothetical protein
MFGLILLLEWPMLQSNLSYVTFQENIEIWSHNAGLINMKCIVKGNKNQGHIIQVIA